MKKCRSVDTVKPTTEEKLEFNVADQAHKTHSQSFSCFSSPSIRGHRKSSQKTSETNKILLGGWEFSKNSHVITSVKW